MQIHFTPAKSATVSSETSNPLQENPAVQRMREARRSAGRLVEAAQKGRLYFHQAWKDHLKVLKKQGKLAA